MNPSHHMSGYNVTAEQRTQVTRMLLIFIVFQFPVFKCSKDENISDIPNQTGDLITAIF